MCDNEFSTERLTKIFLDLAQIDGLCGQEKLVADYITRFLKRLDLSPYEDNVKQYSGGNSGNVVCLIGTGGDRVFLSHMDTARSTRNMKPVIQNGTIRSDGTTVLGVDNRAGIAALLYAVEFLIENKIPLRDCTLAFTVCEETSMDGARYLSLNNGVKMGFVFDSAFEPGHFIHGTCGAVSFTISVHGRASHSGLDPEKGISAIQISTAALSRLPVGKINDSTIINIGTIHGGSAINVVPEKTKIRGEIRSMDVNSIEKTIDMIRNEFNKIIEVKGGSYDLEYTWDFKPYYVEKDKATYCEALRALERVKLQAHPVIAWSGSDANYLNEKNIPTVNFGIGARNPHSNDEYIKINDLKVSTAIALQLMMDS